MLDSLGLKILKPHVEDGVKIFNLTADKIKFEILEKIYVQSYGYNGTSPGPVILAKEGDTIRITLTNNLDKPTTLHSHGILLPNSQDGAYEFGENTPIANPGETVSYSYTLNQNGTYIYHTSHDIMHQLSMGLSGPLIVMPKKKEKQYAKDTILFLQGWALDMPHMKLIPGEYKQNPMEHESNFTSINGRSYPKTKDILVEKGDLIRVRLINISHKTHPIHLHGHYFKVVATDGHPLPKSCTYLKNTLNIGVGETYDIEIQCDNPGIWPFHCHLPHHTSNNMSRMLGGMATRLIYT